GQRSLFLLLALLLHQRDQLPGNERQGAEGDHYDDARHGKDDAQVMGGQPGAQPALGAEQDDEDQAHHHRRDGKGHVDQRNQYRLAAELELGDGPGRRHTEYQIDGHHYQHHHQRQADGRQCIGFVDRRPPDLQALLEGAVQHHSQRQYQKQGKEGERNADKGPAHPGRLLG